MTNAQRREHRQELYRRLQARHVAPDALGYSHFSPAATSVAHGFFLSLCGVLSCQCEHFLRGREEVSALEGIEVESLGDGFPFFSVFRKRSVCFSEKRMQTELTRQPKASRRIVVDGIHNKVCLA